MEKGGFRLPKAMVNLMGCSKNRRTVIWIACFLISVALCLLISGCGGEDVTKNEITSVYLTKSASDISFEINLTKEYVKENKSDKLYLFEFLPYESTADINSKKPVKEFKVGSNVTFKIPYINGNDNRLYSKFAVAEKLDNGNYSLITGAKYVDNIEMLAENTEAFPNRGSKKGLTVQMFSDAQQLGVAHTVVNVPVNEYMLGANTEGAMSFHYNGQTYYLNKAMMAVLDHKVKTYSEAGINVYLNILLSAPAADANDNIRSFYYDGISSDASYFAFNTKNETSMKAFRAFMDYICGRYTTPDHTYGFAPAIIMGFEVNSNSQWNNVGTADLSNYIHSYCTAFRVAYTAMRSHYSEGRVYISLGNNFNYVENPQVDFPAEDFLSAFNAAISSSGNIEWGLSVSAYPSVASGADYWNDAMAQDNFDTPFITMKNIGVLTDYMNKDALLYESEPRSIIIGEFAVSGNPSDGNNMTLQAAAYALAYYTAVKNDDIDAFIYSRHVDNPDEPFYYGLWTNTGIGYASAATKKPIYNVFSLIDTDRSEDVTAFVKQTVGTGVFGSYLGDDVKYKLFNERNVIEPKTAEESDYKRGYKKRLLFDLTEGSLYNFYPSDGASYIELGSLEDGSKTMLYAGISGVPSEYKGISNTITSDTAFEDAHYISLRVMVSAPVELESVDLMLRLQKNSDAESSAAVYSGEVQVKPNVWNNVSFNVRDLTKLTEGDVDVLKLWIRTPDGEWVEGRYGIWLENAVVYTKGGLPVIVVILLVILGLIGLAVLAYGVLFVRAQLIRRKRRLARERMRREQLQRQAAARSMGNASYPPQYPPRPGNGQNMNNTNYRGR